MVSQLTAAMPGRNGNGPAPEMLERLRGLPAHMAAKIKGQPQVLPRVCSVLTRGELGVAHPRRPRGSVLLIGPTGVGKTETTIVFTNYVFDGAAPVRFDMSEYQNQVAVEKLIGESRNDPGLLGRALRGITGGTLLFDEIEKAHPLVLDLFLQIVEDARITLARGETINLTRFYVIFTSNIGSEETMRMETAPFASVERTVLMRVRERLRPEFLGRINEIVVYARLDYTTQREICEEMIATECARLAKLGHAIDVTPEAVEFLVRTGYHRTLGARPMRGTVERELQNAIVYNVLSGGSGSGRIVVDITADRLILVNPLSAFALCLRNE